MPPQRRSPYIQRTTRARQALPEAPIDTRTEMSHIRGLLRVDGRQYGMAQDIAARLTTAERPITAARIRRWALRSREPNDRLYGLLPGIHLQGQRTGTTWYDLQHAAEVAALTRTRAAALL